MALQVQDRVLETTTTTGTGDITLAGAVAGFRQFSAVCSVSDTCYYMIEAIDSSGVPTGDWESGLGTYSAPNTLTRTTVKASSNSNAAVSLSTGTKRVGISVIAASINAQAPATIADCLYWFETYNLNMTSGAAIQVLQNLVPWNTGFYASINGSGSTTSGATLDASTLNGNPVINTAVSTAARYSWLTAATAANTLTNSTVFVVFKPNAIVNAVAQAFISGAANSFQFRISGTGANVGTLELLQTGTASIGTATAGIISAGTWYQANATYASGTGAYAFRVARATAGSGTNAKTISVANFGIFYNQTNSAEDLNCKIAALIVYNRVLTGPEITSVENYLNWRYAV